MDMNSLKKWRLLSPGIIAVLEMLLIFLSMSNDSKEVSSILQYAIKMEYVIPFVFVVTIGIIYYAAKCRSILWKPICEKVSYNINSTLFNIAGEHMPEKLSDKQKRRISYVFYRFVDKDPTLTQKSKRVMCNGLALTCMCDAIILSVLCIIVDIILSIVFSEWLWIALGVNIFLLVICIPTLNILTKRHIDLSNEQLEIIHDEYQEECSMKIKKIISEDESEE